MVAFAGNPLLDWIDGHTEPREFTGANGGVFRYRVAEKAAPEGGKVPLVLFMHGAGERGDDNKRQLNYSAYEGLTRMKRGSDSLPDRFRTENNGLTFHGARRGMTCPRNRR